MPLNFSIFLIVMKTYSKEKKHEFSVCCTVMAKNVALNWFLIFSPKKIYLNQSGLHILFGVIYSFFNFNSILIWGADLKNN